MGFISEFRHKVFVKTIDDSIPEFEEHSEDKLFQDMVTALRKDLAFLEKIYSECDSKTKELRQLISQYQDTHRKARIRLRIYKHKYKR